MDRDGFWQEITDLAKHHKQRSQPVEQLPVVQMEQLESNVYEHIDQLFSGSEVTDSEITPATAELDVTTTVDTPNQSPLEQRDSIWSSLLWSRLFQGSRTPVYAMAMIALFSVGVLAYLLSGNRQSEPLFDIPESVVAADVDRYIQIPQGSSRAFSGALLSERRSAFLAGVAQADLDLIGNGEQPAAHQVALWHHQTTTNTAAVDALDALKRVQSSVARYSAIEQTGFWLKRGYAVEVVHLAAKRSMVDLNTSTLIDALQFYKMQAMMPEPGNTESNNVELKSVSADVAKQYIQNHEKLMVATPAQLPTPEQLQEIVDMTHDMKVLIQ